MVRTKLLFGIKLRIPVFIVIVYFINDCFLLLITEILNLVVILPLEFHLSVFGVKGLSMC